MNPPKLLKKVEKLEAFAQLALDEATAIRKELEGGASGSPKRGKTSKAALMVVANRRKKLSY